MNRNVFSRGFLKCLFKHAIALKIQRISMRDSQSALNKNAPTEDYPSHMSPTSASPEANGPVPGTLLLHLWPVLAAILIVFNDFILKPFWPGKLSGKLSDFGLCFLLPIFIVAVGQWVAWLVAMLFRREWTFSGKWLNGVACCLTLIYFSGLQLSQDFIRFHIWLLGKLIKSHKIVVTPDPTDLWALLMLPLAWMYIEKRTKSHQND